MKKVNKLLTYGIRNIRLPHHGIHKICDSADRVKESAKSGTLVFV